MIALPLPSGVPGQAMGQVLRVVVAIADEVAPGEHHAVDEARVIQAVGVDHVVLLGKGGQQGQVGLESAGEGDGVFRALEGRHPLLEAAMGRAGTRDQPGRRGRKPARVESAVGRLVQGGVAGEPEIIVVREVEQGARERIVPGGGGPFPEETVILLEGPLPAEQPFGVEGVESFSEPVVEHVPGTSKESSPVAYRKIVSDTIFP